MDGFRQSEGIDHRYFEKSLNGAVDVVALGVREAFYQSMKTFPALMDFRIETNARENLLSHFVIVLSLLQSTQAGDWHNL